jgi:hypothetical protein
MTPKVLIVLTSHGKIDATGNPTGWYLVCSTINHPSISTIEIYAQCMKEKETNINYQPEFAHPHEVLKDKVSLTIASPKGGEAPLDPASVKMFESDAVSQTFLKEQRALWENTHKLEDMLPRVGEFDAIFYVGGHGRMFPPRQYTMISSFKKVQKQNEYAC